MPFPLAHPAAALPFRRYCPRHLSFVALLIGSILPDAAYSIDDINKFSDTFSFIFGDAVKNWEWVTNTWDWDDFSHTVPGSIVFCLPVGLALLTIFFYFRSTLIAILPNPHRQVLRAVCENSRKPTFTSASASLLLGSWLHMLWDCFTNGDRSTGEQWAFLRVRIISVGTVHLQTDRVIWWISSVGGMASLVYAYWQFLRREQAPLWSLQRRDTKIYLLWAGMFLVATIIAVPFTLQFASPTKSLPELFDFVHRFSGYFLTALCGLIVLVCITVKTHAPSSRHFSSAP